MKKMLFNSVKLVAFFYFPSYYCSVIELIFVSFYTYIYIENSCTFVLCEVDSTQSGLHYICFLLMLRTSLCLQLIIITFAFSSEKSMDLCFSWEKMANETSTLQNVPPLSTRQTQGWRDYNHNRSCSCMRAMTIPSHCREINCDKASFYN